MSAENKDLKNVDGGADGFPLLEAAASSVPPSGEKEPPSEHVNAPRQNELPAPMMWADEPPEFTKWLRDKCNGDYDDVEVRLVRQYPIRAMQIGWQAATDFWKAKQTAPLSDDVKAVKKEGDSGLKEARSDTTHEGQNVLSESAIELLQYINDTPALLSLLYDIDMLPEQLRVGTNPWINMLIIAAHFRDHAASSVLKRNENQGAAQDNPKSDSLTSAPSSSTREGAATLRDETPTASEQTTHRHS